MNENKVREILQKVINKGYWLAKQNLPLDKKQSLHIDKATLTILERIDKVKNGEIMPDVETINDILDKYLNHYSLTKQVRDITNEAIRQEVKMRLVRNFSVEKIAKAIFNHQHKSSAVTVAKFCGTHWDIAHECEKREARELAQAIFNLIGEK